MTLDERYQAVQKRLTAAQAEAGRRLASDEYAQHRIDNVALRALARDVERACSTALADLQLTESSVKDAEEWAQACEDTLAETPETMRKKLRAAVEEPPIY